MAKIMVGDADLESGHGHSGLCWTSMRAADLKLVGTLPGSPILAIYL
jgi:hypothetical protein